MGRRKDLRKGVRGGPTAPVRDRELLPAVGARVAAGRGVGGSGVRQPTVGAAPDDRRRRPAVVRRVAGFEGPGTAHVTKSGVTDVVLFFTVQSTAVQRSSVRCRNVRSRWSNSARAADLPAATRM